MIHKKVLGTAFGIRALFSAQIRCEYFLSLPSCGLPDFESNPRWLSVLSLEGYVSVHVLHGYDFNGGPAPQVVGGYESGPTEC